MGIYRRRVPVPPQVNAMQWPTGGDDNRILGWLDACDIRISIGPAAVLPDEAPDYTLYLPDGDVLGLMTGWWVVREGEPGEHTFRVMSPEEFHETYEEA